VWWFYTCNPSGLGDGDWEDHSSGPVWEKVTKTPISTKQTCYISYVEDTGRITIQGGPGKKAQDTILKNEAKKKWGHGSSGTALT
jgi:hypothetical protein